MKKFLTTILLTIFALLAASAANAQFKIKIPKLPKVKEQPKAEQQSTPAETKDESAPLERSAETPKAAPRATEPYLTLNAIEVRARTTSYWPTSNNKTLVWLPEIKFIINGPVKSGDRLRVEYGYPGKPNWLWCEPYTEQLEADHWLSTECDGRSFSESLGSQYTGPVNFTIGMFNELAGTKSTVFKGTFNVEKAKPNAPDNATEFVYYVNYDWNLPISYIWLHQDSVYGNRLTRLNISFWTRGSDYASAMDPHIFYQGKEIPSQHSCDEVLLVEPTQYVADSAKPKPIWKRFNCEFYQIFGTDTSNGGVSGDTHRLDQNPGEYEFKLLRTGRLARSIKFTTKAGGNIDNGVATANKIGTWWTIVPATVLGDQDGAYDKNAYKTGAFWGHPLTGFTPN